MTPADVAAGLVATVGRLLDLEDGISVDAELTDLRRKLEVLYTEEAAHRCIPYKELLHMQDASQRAWNLSTTRSWPASKATLKAMVRLLITHVHLVSQLVFAPPEVLRSYVDHHLSEAEKSVLLCLKAAKDLAAVFLCEEANSLLKCGSVIIAAGCNSSWSNAARFSLELSFARLHVALKANQFGEVCGLAEHIARGSMHSKVYREALYQFIFQTCSAAEPVAQKDDDVNSHHQTARDDAFLSLLRLSVRLQTETKLCSLQQQTFLGITQLQCSTVCLRLSFYKEAASMAAESFLHLPCIEPLVVQLKAEALQKHSDTAASLFQVICRDFPSSSEDLFALATVAVDACPDLHSSIVLSLQQQRLPDVADTQQITEYRFRLSCLLLHVRSEFSSKELLTLLSSWTVEPVLHRFFFTALWAVARNNGEDGENTINDPITPLTRLRCLEMGYRFRHVAAPDEAEACLQDIAAASLQMFQTSNETDESALKQTWELYRALDSCDYTWNGTSVILQCKIGYLLHHDTVSNAVIRRYLSRPTLTGVSPAVLCAELVQFLIQRNELPAAGTIAADLLASTAALPPEVALDFAHTFAVGALANVNEESEEDGNCYMDAANFALNHVSPLLLSSFVDSPLEGAWWSRFFWYLGDRLADTNPALAVQLTDIGFKLWSQCSSATDDGDRDQLIDRLVFLLNIEFELFAGGEPSLSVDDLHRYMSLLEESEKLTPTDSNTGHSRGLVTRYLARCEERLRSIDPANDAEISENELLPFNSNAALPHVGAAEWETVANAVSRVAVQLQLEPLSQIAVTAQLKAAECYISLLPAGPLTSALCTVLALFYKAFEMSREPSVRLRVAVELQKSLSSIEMEKSVKLCHIIGGSAAETLENTAVSEIETMLEFFAVESWNYCVYYNVAQDRVMLEKWHHLALSLSDMLTSTNPAKLAIAEFALLMPLS